MAGDRAFNADKSRVGFRDECITALTDSLHGFTSYPKLRAALQRRLGDGRSIAEPAPYVVAIGKAALSMCSAAASVVPQIQRGIAVVPHGYSSTWTADLPWNGRLQVVEGAHPVSDASSCAASSAVEDALRLLTNRDRVLVLISGGGSALVGCPIDGLSDDVYWSALSQLYKSGKPIGEVNLIRQGLSRLAGGGLLARAAPARVFAFVLSDVPGDRIATVASGPCSPVTAEEATRAESAIATLLGSEVASLAAERLRHNAPRARSLACLELIGTNHELLETVGRHLEKRGIRVAAFRALSGEAADSGKAEGARAAIELRPGEAVLLGGECTVTVSGAGRGGRSQEFVLAAAQALYEARRVAVVASLGTDGYDGPTDAAGAVLISDDRHMVAIADKVSPSLEDNNAYPLLKSADGLLFTGPTHTNVMDIALIARPRGKNESD